MKISQKTAKLVTDLNNFLQNLSYLIYSHKRQCL